MTAVLEAADSRYLARVLCKNIPSKGVDCNEISRSVYNCGREFIPGVESCSAEHRGNILVLNIAYTSAIIPDEIRSKIYATVLVAKQEHLSLDNLTAVRIDIKNA